MSATKVLDSIENVNGYQDHEYADLLPLLRQKDLEELAEDIKAHGLLAPITLLDGKILDGRNRYRACVLVSVKPKFRVFPADDDPISFITSVNVKRRHMTTGQRAMFAAKVAGLKPGRPSAGNSANLQNKKTAASRFSSIRRRSTACQKAARRAALVRCRSLMCARWQSTFWRGFPSLRADSTSTA